MFAEMSESVVLNISTAILSLVGTIFSGLMAFFLARMTQQGALATKQMELAAALREAQDLKSEAKFAELTEIATETRNTGDAVHLLTNSAMSAALQATSAALRRIAVLTKDPEDAKAAKLAESGFQIHEAKQNLVEQGVRLAKFGVMSEPTAQKNEDKVTESAEQGKKNEEQRKADPDPGKKHEEQGKKKDQGKPDPDSGKKKS